MISETFPYPGSTSEEKNAHVMCFCHLHVLSRNSSTGLVCCSHPIFFDLERIHFSSFCFLNALLDWFIVMVFMYDTVTMQLHVNSFYM